MLIKALVVPHLSYCDVLFYNSNIELINRIVISVKACIRFIHNLSFSESTLPHFNSVLGSSLTVFYKVRALTFIFGVIRKGTPEYLTGFFRFSQISSLRLVRSGHQSRFIYRNVLVDGVRLWNELPLALRKITTLKRFKSECRDHFNAREALNRI